LSNLENFYFIELQFKELKSLLSKISKAKKDGIVLKYEISCNGDLRVFYNYFNKTLSRELEQTLFYKDFDFANKYLKHLIEQVENPE